MKPLGWILLGLVAGVLVGGVSPRADLAAERAENGRLEDALVRARRKAARCSSGGVGLLPGMGSLLPEVPAAAAPEEEENRDRPAGDGFVADEPDDERSGLEPDAGGTGGGTGGPDGSFDAAVEAQQIRAEQSRAALAEQAGLDEAELEVVDEVIREMNGRLEPYADELVMLAEAGDDVTPREVLGFTHELSGVLLESQTAFEDAVGKDRMQNVDGNTGAVWNYLDLEVMRDAVENGGGD